MLWLNPVSLLCWLCASACRLLQPVEAWFVRATVTRLALGLLCSGVWLQHTYKLRKMRHAWGGVVLHSPDALLRGAMLALKANRREQQLQHALLHSCFCEWQARAVRNKAATDMRKRVMQVCV